MLPTELHNQHEVLAAFRDDFGFANEMLGLAIRATERLAEVNKVGFRPITKAVVLNILTRETRRYASIMTLAAYGYLENVDVLSRCLFEGLLAERFIFHKPKPWATCSKELRRARKGLPPIPGRYSAIEYRSWLYACFSHIRLCSISRSVREKDGAATVSDATARVFERAGSSAEKTLGKDWARAQRTAHSCSGLTIKQLAENVGLDYEHSTFYGPQCLKTHAADAVDCLAPTGDHTICVRLVSGVSDLHGLPIGLRLASGLLGLLVSDLNAVFSLGVGDEVARVLDLARERTRAAL